MPDYAGALSALRGLPALPLQPGWETLRYRCELITPMFGGGVAAGDPDKEWPIRATGIRGQWRFWWRLLASRAASGFPACATPARLFEEEANVFGAIRGRGPVAGALRLAIVRHTPAALSEYDGAAPTRYALFAAQRQQAQPARQLTDPGLQFELLLQVAPAKRGQIEEVIRWWASFGGLGARTRRGVGSVAVWQLTGQDETLLAPVTDSESAAVGCALKPKPPGASASAAWRQALQRLQDYMQGAGIARDAATKVSLWPEAYAIRTLAGCRHPMHSPTHAANGTSVGNVFPRGCFGMPRIFRFKRGEHDAYPDCDPDTRSLEPSAGGRLASRVIVKARAVTVGGAIRYEPIALRLPLDGVGEIGATLHHRARHAEKREPGAPPAHAVSLWPAAAATSVTPLIRPIAGHGGGATDPLQAFLNFF